MHKSIPVFILPLMIVIVSGLIGLLMDRYLVNKWIQRTRRLKRPFLKVISTSLKGIVIVLALLIGLDFAINNMPIGDDQLHLINKGMIVLFIVAITTWVARLSTGIIDMYGRRKKMPALTLFTNLTKIIIFIIGFLIILQSLGISVTPLLTALGVGGLAVALALQDTLSNLFSGIQIISSRLVMPGDYIKLSTGEEGYVRDVNWRNTVICTMANNENIIPNSELAKSILTNFSRPEKEMSLVVPISVSYDSDLAKVESVTIAVAQEVLNEIEGGVNEFTPFTRYTGFSESGINFNVIMRVQKFDAQFPIKHEFIKRIHVRFLQEKIEIPFPVRTVILKSQP